MAAACSPSYTSLLFARALVGFAAAGSHVAPTLFAEMAPTSVRGKYVVLQSAFWAVGSIAEALLATGRFEFTAGAVIISAGPCEDIDRARDTL